MNLNIFYYSIKNMKKIYICNNYGKETMLIKKNIIDIILNTIKNNIYLES